MKRPDTLNTGSRMLQMQNCPGPVYLRTMRQHLRYAAHVAANLVSHQSFIIASGAIPKLLTRERKFTGAEAVIRNHLAVAQAAEKTYMLLFILAPGHIYSLGGPDDLGWQLTAKNFVFRIPSQRGISVRCEYPRTTCAAYANILCVIFQQLQIRIAVDRLMDFRRHYVSPQAVE